MIQGHREGHGRRAAVAFSQRDIVNGDRGVIIILNGPLPCTVDDDCTDRIH